LNRELESRRTTLLLTKVKVNIEAIGDYEDTEKVRNLLKELQSANDVFQHSEVLRMLDESRV
jgi:hypothetical protein